jgi:hypothetical protein
MWESENSYQRILENALAEVPYRIAANVVSEKLAADGAEMTEEERLRLFEHLAGEPQLGRQAGRRDQRQRRRRRQRFVHAHADGRHHAQLVHDHAVVHDHAEEREGEALLR